MKKRFVLSYFLLTLFLFVSFLFMKREKDKSNVYNLFDFYQNQQVNSIILNKEYKPSEISNLLKYLESYGKSNSTKFIINNYIFDDSAKVKKIVYYIAADEEYINKKILVFSNKDIDLDKSYISSINEKNAEYLHLFTDDIDIEIHKFSDILKEDKLINSIHYFPDSKTEKENIESDLTAKYSKYIDSFGVSNTEFYDIDRDLIRNMIYYSIICFVLFFLVNIFIVSKKLKDLSIYRLNGYKTKDIILEIFKSNIRIVFICSLILPILYYILFINHYDYRSTSFLLQFYKYIILFNILYIISLLIIYNIVRKMSISMLTKRYNFNYYILKNTILMGIVLIIPLSTIQNPDLKDLVNDKLDNLVKIIKMKENYNDIVISSGFKSESRNLSFNQEDVGSKIKNRNNDKHIEIYNRFESKKSIYKYQHSLLVNSNEEEFYTTDVNKKLLDDLRLKNNQKGISIKFEPNSLYLFMNKNEFNKDLWAKYKNDYYDKIFFVVYDEFRDLGLDIFQYTSNSFPIISYSTREDYPIYKTIESDTIFLNTNKEKIESILSEYNWDSKIILREGNDIFEEVNKVYTKELLILIFRLFPGIIISIYIISTIEKFYFESMKKKWAILYTNGWKKWDVIKSFMAISICFILIISFLQLVIYKEIKGYYNIFLSMVFLYEQLLLLRKYSKINADMILQGKED